MEIAKLSDTSVRIKGKVATLAIAPLGLKAKPAVDAALFLQHTFDMKNLTVEGETIIINGPGEYEIKSVKFVGKGKGEDLGYLARIEGMLVYMVKASSLVKSKELMEDCQVLLVDADVAVEENVVAASNAQVAVLFGAHAQEIAKQLGKENAPVGKYVTTKDKLPAETEVVVLG
jgi:hypothetical protein